MIGIALDRTTVEAGEFLTGTVQWSGEPDRAARLVIAAAYWRTDGAGNVAHGLGRVAQFKVPAGQRDATLPLRMLIPHEGPVSFQGELIAVEWKLHVRVDQRGIDEQIETGFRVSVRR